MDSVIGLDPEKQDREEAMRLVTELEKYSTTWDWLDGLIVVSPSPLESIS